MRTNHAVNIKTKPHGGATVKASRIHPLGTMNNNPDVVIAIINMAKMWFSLVL